MDRSAILIATASVGAGHIRAAEAVREALLTVDSSRQVDLVDVLTFGPRWARRFYRDAFLRIAAVSRSAAYRLYVGTDGDTPDGGDHRAERVIYHRFREFVEQGPWHDIVCTHFLPSRVIDVDRRPAMHMVVTDFALHRYWVQPNIDNFFVATETMAETVRARLPCSAAYATGIPVLARFSQSLDPVVIRRELHIDGDAPVALVIGGGWGLGVNQMVRNTLRAQVPGLVVITVCGANQQAYQSVSRIASDRLRTFGYVDDVAPLMCASDLIISKPGGVTTAEALSVRRPLLLTRGVPGQEDRNALELTRLGVAELVDSHHLASSVEQFFHNTELRRQRAVALARVCRNSAAETIAAYFEEPQRRYA